MIMQGIGPRVAKNVAASDSPTGDTKRPIRRGRFRNSWFCRIIPNNLDGARQKQEYFAEAQRRADQLVAGSSPNHESRWLTNSGSFFLEGTPQRPCTGSHKYQHWRFIYSSCHFTRAKSEVSTPNTFTPLLHIFSLFPPSTPPLSLSLFIME